MLARHSVLTFVLPQVNFICPQRIYVHCCIWIYRSLLKNLKHQLLGMKGSHVNVAHFLWPQQQEFWWSLAGHAPNFLDCLSICRFTGIVTLAYGRIFKIKLKNSDLQQLGPCTPTNSPPLSIVDCGWVRWSSYIQWQWRQSTSIENSCTVMASRSDIHIVSKVSDNINIIFCLITRKYWCHKITISN